MKQMPVICDEIHSHQLHVCVRTKDRWPFFFYYIPFAIRIPLARHPVPANAADTKSAYILMFIDYV